MILVPARKASKPLWLRFSERAGDRDVVAGLGFAVRTDGAEGEVIGGAFVLIGAVPWVHANHTREIVRAQMIDQDGLAVGNNKRATFTAVIAEGFGDR